MVAGFNELLANMAQFDIFAGVLPFVLTYVVFYAALDNVPVINDDDKFPPLIAVVVAFFVARFITVNPFYQDFFMGFFGRLTVGLLGFVGLLVLLAFTGYDSLGDDNRPILALLMILIAGAAFTTAGGFSEIWNIALGGTNPAEPTFDFVEFTLDSGLIWIILVAIALVWVSSDRGQDDTGLSEAGKWLFGNNGGSTGEG